MFGVGAQIKFREMLKNMAMELYYVNFHSHATHNKQKIMPDTLVDKCAYMDRTNNQKKKIKSEELAITT